MKHKIYRFKKLNSTNKFLKENCDKYTPYSVIIADEQEEGHGRYQRKWHSAKGKDLTFSLLLPLNKKESYIWANITQITAIAILETAKEYRLDSKIKWPNDILIDDQKISGILTEVISCKTGSYAIVGVGININSSKKELISINQKATSFFVESKIEHRIDIILDKILKKIVDNYTILSQNGFEPFYKTFSDNLAWKDRLITLKDGNKSIMGTIINLNKDGTLNFKYKNSSDIITLNSGELLQY